MATSILGAFALAEGSGLASGLPAFGDSAACLSASALSSLAAFPASLPSPASEKVVDRLRPVVEVAGDEAAQALGLVHHGDVGPISERVVQPVGQHLPEAVAEDIDEQGGILGGCRRCFLGDILRRRRRLALLSVPARPVALVGGDVAAAIAAARAAPAPVAGISRCALARHGLATTAEEIAEPALRGRRRHRESGGEQREHDDMERADGRHAGP